MRSPSVAIAAGEATVVGVAVRRFAAEAVVEVAVRRFEAVAAEASAEAAALAVRGALAEGVAARHFAEAGALKAVAHSAVAQAEGHRIAAT